MNRLVCNRRYFPIAVLKYFNDFCWGVIVFFCVYDMSLPGTIWNLLYMDVTILFAVEPPIIYFVSKFVIV